MFKEKIDVDFFVDNLIKQLEQIDEFIIKGIKDELWEESIHDDLFIQCSIVYFFTITHFMETFYPKKENLEIILDKFHNKALIAVQEKIPGLNVYDFQSAFENIYSFGRAKIEDDIETSFKEIASLICKNVWGNDNDLSKKIAISWWAGAIMTNFAKLIKETVDRIALKPSI